MTVTEVVLSSSADDDHILLWDLRTLAVLGSYKGNPRCARHGIAPVGSRLIIGTQQDKAAMRVWSWEKDQPLHKFSGPEKIPIICSTQDGSVCVGGSGTGKIFVWLTSTGTLARVFDAHFKAVTVLKFSDDGGMLISGGADGAVHIWNTTDLLTGHATSAPSPIMSLSDHSLAITDIYVGIGGARARIATASSDRTCKIWELATGQLLCNFSFPTAINTIVMDPAEFHLYVGGTNGAVYNIALYDTTYAHSRSPKEANIPADQAMQAEGQPVTRLALSYDATLLLVGMGDGTVATWDVSCGQLLKTFRQHKGEVTNLLSSTAPPTVLTQRFSMASLPPFTPFARYLPEIPQHLAREVKILTPAQESSKERDWGHTVHNLTVDGQRDDEKRRLISEKEKIEANNAVLLAENERIRRLNTELYQRAVANTLSNN